MEIIEEQMQKAREELKEKIPMSKYLMDNKLGYDLGEKGKIRCMVHDDSSPSFFYDDELGTGNCFGCGVKGTVLEIHYARIKQEDERYTQVRAIRDLAKKYGVKIPNLYKRDMSRYGKNHINPSKRQRGSGMTEDMYRVKVNDLTKQINAIEDVAVRMKLFKVIDSMWLGNTTAKDAHAELLRELSVIRAEERRKLLEGRNRER